MSTFFFPAETWTHAAIFYSKSEDRQEISRGSSPPSLSLRACRRQAWQSAKRCEVVENNRGNLMELQDEVSAVDKYSILVILKKT